jgi:hypothetical protein
MSLARITELYQFFWQFKTGSEQRKAWADAAEARVARARAEAQAAAQLQAMLDANPSGSLGNAQLNDFDKLMRSGLL